MSHWQGGILIATQYVRANLASRINGAEWRAGPCTSARLYKRFGPNKTARTCVMINPRLVTVGNRSMVFLDVVVEQGGMNAAYYLSVISLNSEVFGFSGSSVSDWTSSEVAKSPRRQKFLQQLTSWSELLTTAVEQSFHDKESGLAYFQSVPSYLSLMSVPDDLRDKGYSMAFLGAVVSLSDRPGYRAIAYAHITEGVTRWSSIWNQVTQADADELALKNCERERAPSRPACVLYPMDANPKPAEN
jgi:hypothetical protein